jgi:hypothetical protein
MLTEKKTTRKTCFLRVKIDKAINLESHKFVYETVQTSDIDICFIIKSQQKELHK